MVGATTRRRRRSSAAPRAARPRPQRGLAAVEAVGPPVAVEQDDRDGDRAAGAGSFLEAARRPDGEVRIDHQAEPTGLAGQCEARG